MCTTANESQQDRSSELLDAAILIADIVGYTELFGSHGVAPVQSYVSRVLPEVNGIILEHSPLLKNTWGDSVIVVFRSAMQAAHCALDLRDYFRDEDRWNSLRIPTQRIRISLHRGPMWYGEDPIREGSNVIGHHVNLAARVEPAIAPNEVWTTDEFLDALDLLECPEVEAVDLGERPLAKDFKARKLYRLQRRSDDVSPMPSRIESHFVHLAKASPYYPTHLVSLCVDNYLAAIARIRQYGHQVPHAVRAVYGLYGNADLLLELRLNGATSPSVALREFLTASDLETQVRPAQPDPSFGTLDRRRLPRMLPQAGCARLEQPLLYMGVRVDQSGDLADNRAWYPNLSRNSDLIVAHVMLEGPSRQARDFATNLLTGSCFDSHEMALRDSFVLSVIPIERRGAWLFCAFPSKRYYEFTAFTKALDQLCRRFAYKLTLNTTLVAEVLHWPRVMPTE